MEDITERLDDLNWSSVSQNLNLKGYDVINQVATSEECDDLISQYNNPNRYRKTISMERYRFGMGEYKYLSYPLPDFIQRLRKVVYSKIFETANLWMEALKIDIVYPETHEEFISICHSSGQTKPTVLILKYGQKGHNTLHQDLYGDVFFPIQLVIFLSEPGIDYTGGEFVLTQQTPRAQSKAIVLQPRKGDMVLFTTNFRPVHGTRGYYKAMMKHGVSEVHSGSRYTLGIIFHDALT